MKQRKTYEAPLTSVMTVELEGDLCASTTVDDKTGVETGNRHVNIEEQERGEADFGTSWD